MVGSVAELENELVVLSALLTAPEEGECLFCYVFRMLTVHGCNNRLRWAARWRDLRAPRATALERTLGSRGGYCDCEIFMNGWTASPAIWPDPMPKCQDVRPRSSQPCSHWQRMSRRGGGW